jgi:hypothetical protein
MTTAKSLFIAFCSTKTFPRYPREAKYIDIVRPTKVREAVLANVSFVALVVSRASR